MIETQRRGSDAFERSLQPRLTTKGLMFQSIPSTKANADELIGRKGPSTFTTIILEHAFEIEPHTPPPKNSFHLISRPYSQQTSSPSIIQRKLPR